MQVLRICSNKSRCSITRTIWAGSRCGRFRAYFKGEYLIIGSLSILRSRHLQVTTIKFSSVLIVSFLSWSQFCSHEKRYTSLLFNWARTCICYLVPASNTWLPVATIWLYWCCPYNGDCNEKDQDWLTNKRRDHNSMGHWLLLAIFFQHEQVSLQALNLESFCTPVIELFVRRLLRVNSLWIISNNNCSCIQSATSHGCEQNRAAGSWGGKGREEDDFMSRA